MAPHVFQVRNKPGSAVLRPSVGVAFGARWFTSGGFFLPSHAFAGLIPIMGTKTTFVCDCCLRQSDNNLGWAQVSIKQLMAEDNRDLCEICWSPLQTLMKKVHDEARERRSSAADPPKK
jgi:hypothetical protein